MDINDFSNLDLSGFNNVDELAAFIRDYYYKTADSARNKDSDNKDNSNEEGGDPIESSGSGNWTPGTGSNKGTDHGTECGDDCIFGNKIADATECSRKANSDIPGGFQDINPVYFNIITVIVGSLIAQEMPFNIQNAVGNWLQLLGQSIINFNAQQQYYQGGPGRLYAARYRNAANPFCSDSSDESQANVSSTKSKNRKKSSSTNTSKSQKGKRYYNEEDNGNNDEIRGYIKELTDEINNLKAEIENMKKM